MSREDSIVEIRANWKKMSSKEISKAISEHLNSFVEPSKKVSVYEDGLTMLNAPLLKSS